MVFAVRDLMQDAYPELNETADRVSKAVLAEETRFAHTMEVGLEKLETLLKSSQRDNLRARMRSSSTTRSECRSTSCRMRRGTRGSRLIDAGFDRAMDEQKARARASWKGAAKQTANPAYQ